MVELRSVPALRLRFVHENRWKIPALALLGPPAAAAAEDHLSNELIPRPRKTEGRGRLLSLANVPYLRLQPVSAMLEAWSLVLSPALLVHYCPKSLKYQYLYTQWSVLRSSMARPSPVGAETAAH